MAKIQIDRSRLIQLGILLALGGFLLGYGLGAHPLPMPMQVPESWGPPDVPCPCDDPKPEASPLIIIKDEGPDGDAA